MIQPTYISERKCGNKWYPMDDLPVPLLRTNYLSEFRTEIEKARARKNLGIPDEMQMKWGGMSGYIEEQRDLIKYMEKKWKYTTELSKDITTVAQALDYIMELITTYTDQNESLNKVQEDIKSLDSDIKKTDADLRDIEKALQDNIDINAGEIGKLQEAIKNINGRIDKLNEDLINLDISSKVLAWMKAHTSETIEITEGEKIAVVISEQENNAVKNDNGIFVKDNTPDIQANATAILGLLNFEKEIKGLVSGHEELIADLREDIDDINVGIAGYNTELEKTLTTPNAVGGIPAGTTVESLSKKTLVLIIDDLLFPTVVKDPIYPTLSYSTSILSTIKIGTSAYKPIKVFNPGDSGGEISTTEKLLLDGVEIPLETAKFDLLGTYTYQITVEYAQGAPMKDNKGQEVPDKYVPSGSLSRSVSHTTTYPWFVNGVEQSYLVKMGSSSGIRTITMGGKASIELPGANSSISSLKVDGGMGYMPVNWEAWDITTKTKDEYPNIVYKVWTLKSEYAKDLNHEINFTLAL